MQLQRRWQHDGNSPEHDLLFRGFLRRGQRFRRMAGTSSGHILLQHPFKGCQQDNRRGNEVLGDRVVGNPRRLLGLVLHARLRLHGPAPPRLREPRRDRQRRRDVHPHVLQDQQRPRAVVHGQAQGPQPHGGRTRRRRRDRRAQGMRLQVHLVLHERRQQRHAGLDDGILRGGEDVQGRPDIHRLSGVQRRPRRVRVPVRRGPLGRELRGEHRQPQHRHGQLLGGRLLHLHPVRGRVLRGCDAVHLRHIVLFQRPVPLQAARVQRRL